MELERLSPKDTLIERRNTMELFRDQAAERFEGHTGSAWRPRTGSMVNHRTLTAAMIDSRDFLAARRRADNELLLPAGPKIAFTGGLDFNDHHDLAPLDKVRPKHPDMVLLHAAPDGCRRIDARWADNRKVRISRSSPIGPVTPRPHPSSATTRCSRSCRSASSSSRVRHQKNLADKARRLGIPVWRFGKGGA